MGEVYTQDQRQADIARWADLMAQNPPRLHEVEGLGLRRLGALVAARSGNERRVGVELNIALNRRHAGLVVSIPVGQEVLLNRAGIKPGTLAVAYLVRYKSNDPLGNVADKAYYFMATAEGVRYICTHAELAGTSAEG